MIRDVLRQEHEAPCERRTKRLARNTLSVRWLLAPAAVQRQLVTWDVEHLWVETAKDLFTFGAVLAQGTFATTTNQHHQQRQRRPRQQHWTHMDNLKIQPLVHPGVDSPSASCISNTNLSYSFPILKLPLPPCAVLPGIYIYIICILFDCSTWSLDLHDTWDCTR